MPSDTTLLQLVLSVTALTLCCPLTTANDSTLLFLLPLSGTYYGEGVAARVGAELALTHAGFVNNSRVEKGGGLLRVVFENTECNTETERGIISQYIAKGNKFYIVGGGCYSYQHKFKLPVLLDIVPQIMFHQMPIPFTQLQRSFSLMPFQPTGFVELASKIRNRNFTSIVLVHDNDINFLQNYNAVLLEFRNQNIEIEVSINLYDVNGKEKSLHVLVQLIEKAKSRLIIFFADIGNLVNVFCAKFSKKNRFHLMSVISEKKRLDIKNLHCFANKTFTTTIYHYSPVVDAMNQTFLVDYRGTIGGLSQLTVALAYDATVMMTQAIQAANGSDTNLVNFVRNQNWNLASGKLVFNPTYQDRSVTLTSLVDEEGPSTNEVTESYELVQAHTAVIVIVFVGICALVCYAIVIIVFNLFNRSQKMIKLTSVPLNVVLTSMSLLLGVALLLNGIAEISDNTNIKQTFKNVSFCIFPIPFSTLLVAHWLKLYRINKVFNVAVRNKSCMKDGVFCLWIFLAGLTDLIATVTIVILDPIQCELKLWKTHDVSVSHTTHYQHYFCTNQYWYLWICLLFILKLPPFILSLIYAWKIRDITLPSLRDFKPTFIAFFAMLGLSLVATPSLLEPLHPSIAFGVSSISYLSMFFIYFTFLFAPKMHLLWKSQKNGDTTLISKPSFHESFRKRKPASSTRAKNPQSSCCWCLSGHEDDEEDESEVTANCLQQEIQTLKKGMQERDRTIRELNDRLFFGHNKQVNGSFYPRNSYSPGDYSLSTLPIKRPSSQSSRSPPSGNSGSNPSPNPNIYGITSIASESDISATKAKYMYKPNRPPRKSKLSSNSSNNSDLGFPANASHTSSILKTSLSELSEVNRLAQFSDPSSYKSLAEDPNNVKIGFGSSSQWSLNRRSDILKDGLIQEDEEDVIYFPSILLEDLQVPNGYSDTSSDLDELDTRLHEVEVELHDIHIQERRSSSPPLSKHSGSLVSTLVSDYFQSESLRPADLRIKPPANHSIPSTSTTSYSTNGIRRSAPQGFNPSYNRSNTSPINSNNLFLKQPVTNQPAGSDRYPSMITVNL